MCCTKSFGIGNGKAPRSLRRQRIAASKKKECRGIVVGQRYGASVGPDMVHVGMQPAATCRRQRAIRSMTSPSGGEVPTMRWRSCSGSAQRRIGEPGEAQLVLAALAKRLPTQWHHSATGMLAASLITFVCGFPPPCSSSCCFPSPPPHRGSACRPAASPAPFDRHRRHGEALLQRPLGALPPWPAGASSAACCSMGFFDQASTSVETHKPRPRSKEYPCLPHMAALAPE